jgi:serine/threonine protein kinase
LAKRHDKDTILRIDPTDTRYTTLHYEAPEVVTSTKPRSRRYDIWSMGCMEHILKEDPECNKGTDTAIRDLLKLVQNKLLVVPLDGSLSQCRCDASTLQQELRVIWARARDESSYLFTGTSRADLPSPKPLIQKRGFLSTSATPGHPRRPSEPGRPATAQNPLVSCASFSTVTFLI